MKKLLYILPFLLLAQISFGQGIKTIKVQGGAPVLYKPDTVNVLTSKLRGDSLAAAIAAKGNGTVTSISTGYGVSGGLITSTGTISVDSAALSTKYLRISDVSNYGSSINVSNTALLSVYAGTANTVNVTDTLQGGSFIYSTTTNATNGGTVFAAIGKGSGYWIRQYDRAKGVSVGWWGGDDKSIDSAISYAGINGKVIFTPNKKYFQKKVHVPISGQTWVGNNATLQRQTETVTTLTSTLLASSSTFNVASVPSTWNVGDNLQVFITQSWAGASNIVTISAISGNSITLTSPIGNSLTGSTSYAAASVWKVWNQVDNFYSYVNFNIDNLNFDGNSGTSCPNVYWNANVCISSRSQITRITNCSFVSMGNDCIDGHGLYIAGCYSNNLNNGFVHVSADFTTTPATYPTQIFDNRVFNSNRVASLTGSGHSEGVITLSFSSGYLNVHNNWFSGGLDAVLGTIQGTNIPQDGGSRYIRFVNNQCFNFSGVVKGVFTSATGIKAGIALIEGNTFSNCGITSPFPPDVSGSWAYIDKITFLNNDLCDGTSVTIPAHVYSTSTIANTNGTTNIQTGTSFNIDGTANIGSNMAVNGNVSIGSTSFPNKLYVNVGSNPSDGISVHGTVAPLSEISNGTYSLQYALATGAGNYSSISNAGDVIVRSTGQASNGSMIAAIANTTGDFKVTTRGGTGSTDSLKFVVKQDGRVGVTTLNTGLVTDSLVVVNGGFLKRVPSSNKLNTSALNGGSTNQVLSKNSNTDQDYSWATPSISGGSFATAYVAKTSAYTATISDYTIDCTTGTFTVTLPTAVGIAGRIYVVTNSGSGTITVATTSSQTFTNVTATPTSLTITTVGSVTVQSNGANWLEIGKL